MSLRREIIPYVDGNGLVAPELCDPTTRGSDNGTMFTSEYYIMLNRNGELTSNDITEYQNKIVRCVGDDKELHRAPGDTSPDEIDDYLGVLAGYAEFGLKVPFKLPIRLMRFSQLTFAYLVNKINPFLLFGITLAPLSLLKWTFLGAVPLGLYMFLSLYNAISLAISCIGVSKDENGDARRLNWLLWQATKRKSLLAYLAGSFWHWREARKMGTNEVMKYVASHLYYQQDPPHPFGRYWID